MYKQFVVKYQPAAAAFPADSRAPRPALHGSIEHWHQQMGHLNEEAVKHLPQAVTGVIVDQSNSKPLGICETYRLSQAPQQISRRPLEKSTRPFQQVHFDLIPLEEAFNGDHWVLHFLEDLSKFNFVYTL